jgi:hypothetical protein
MPMRWRVRFTFVNGTLLAWHVVRNGAQMAKRSNAQGAAIMPSRFFDMSPAVADVRIPPQPLSRNHSLVRVSYSWPDTVR